nr:classical arabinogalactan protein 9-like [Lolium perenne]
MAPPRCPASPAPGPAPAERAQALRRPASPAPGRTSPGPAPSSPPLRCRRPASPAPGRTSPVPAPSSPRSAAAAQPRQLPAEPAQAPPRPELAPAPLPPPHPDAAAPTRILVSIDTRACTVDDSARRRRSATWRPRWRRRRARALGTRSLRYRDVVEMLRDYMPSRGTAYASSLSSCSSGSGDIAAAAYDFAADGNRHLIAGPDECIQLCILLCTGE